MPSRASSSRAASRSAAVGAVLGSWAGHAGSPPVASWARVEGRVQGCGWVDDQARTGRGRRPAAPGRRRPGRSGGAARRGCAGGRCPVDLMAAGRVGHDDERPGRLADVEAVPGGQPSACEDGPVGDPAAVVDRGHPVDERSACAADRAAAAAAGSGRRADGRRHRRPARAGGDGGTTSGATRSHGDHHRTRHRCGPARGRSACAGTCEHGSDVAGMPRIVCPRGDLNPHARIRALAPQASASAIPPLGPALSQAHSRADLVRPSMPTGDAASGRKSRVTEHERTRARGRGRRALPRPDPDRHHQHRRHATPRAGERAAAEYVAGEARRGRHRGPRSSSRAPGRASVVARHPGRRPQPRARCWCTATSTWCRPTPTEWSVHPFSGEIQRRLPLGPRRGRHEGLRRDGARRGARLAARRACVPPRDLVLAFLADEEAGGDYGAHWLVDNHARPVRGLHRGDRRGRRLLLHRRATTCGST